MAGRNWDHIVSAETDRIKKAAAQDNKVLLSRIDASAVKLGALIDQCLNDVTVPEFRDGDIFHVIRRDQRACDWESVFSTVNMSFPIIIEGTLQGYYWLSAGMFRQALEAFVQLTHIITGRRDDPKSQSRAPNVANLSQDLKHIYNKLSEISHLSTREAALIQSPIHDINDRLGAKLPHGASLVPKYEPGYCQDLLELCLQLREMLYIEFEKHFQVNLYPKNN